MDTLLNIIVVEDHDALREVTVEALNTAGHHVIGLDSAEAFTDSGAKSVDLMVIDLNLPGEDGISLARRMRESQPEIGIIMLTARTQPTDKMVGYQSGADIYLTKPTSVEELDAAIHALARRIKPPSREAATLILDMEHLVLIGSGGQTRLTTHEAVILAAFIRAPKRQLENWQLIELLGKNTAEYSKAALEVHIVRLRKKLVQAGTQDQPIKAIREYGYQLCERIRLL